MDGWMDGLPRMEERGRGGVGGLYYTRFEGLVWRFLVLIEWMNECVHACIGGMKFRVTRFC